MAHAGSQQDYWHVGSGLGSKARAGQGRATRVAFQLRCYEVAAAGAGWRTAGGRMVPIHSGKALM
jgi:hypothetical protein